MKALLDTNIIIHRETGTILNHDIGILFRWLDKAKYIKCVHPLTIEEIKKNINKATVAAFVVKLDSYEILKTLALNNEAIERAAAEFDVTENDKIDTRLLNEVYSERVDILISEDKKIHLKADYLGIADKVFTINSFLEKVVSEHPEQINYKVLSIKQEHFGNIDLNDPFFDSLKEDYTGFAKWFNKKADERAYQKDKLLSFLYLKVEGLEEKYSDIIPDFSPKKRLKVGTFKVGSNGVRISERFLRIIFDNALQFNVNEIYLTILDKRMGQKMLISLLEDWGFVKHGSKGDELVYVRDFTPAFNVKNPKLTYPFISEDASVFLVPILPEYHTELFPDSYLKTESPGDFKEDEPHRNAISKVYISRSLERNIKTGDIIVFYRTAAPGQSGYYSSVITTIGLVEEKMDGIKNENEFIIKCRKRSIFTDDDLRKFWNYNPRFRPFVVKLLYVYSFTLGNRLNRERLLGLGIITGQKDELRGFKKISKEQFGIIIRETNTNESIVVH